MKTFAKPGIRRTSRRDRYNPENFHCFRFVWMNLVKLTCFLCLFTGICLKPFREVISSCPCWNFKCLSSCLKFW